MKHAFVSGLAVIAGLTGTAMASTSVAPPFDVAAVRAEVGHKDKKPLDCGSPPAPLRDLHMESFYDKSEGTASVVKPEAYAAYKAANKPVARFEQGIESVANRYVKSNPPRPDLAACTLDWLDAWAEGGALMGDVNKNGEYTRSWVIGSIASAYLQIRNEPALDPAKKKAVEGWMREVANAVVDDFSRDTGLKSRRNNHLYWAAWGVASAGMALDDEKLFKWGIDGARQGIDDIQPNGTLPLELARGQRAYLYHLFAAMPLFMLANAAEKNGIDLFRRNDQGLRRLGDLCLKNLPHPDDFAQWTGRDQDLTHVGTPSDLGWVEIYRQHYDDPRADATLASFRPMKQSRFGGNITLLYSGVNAKAGKKDG